MIRNNYKPVFLRSELDPAHGAKAHFQGCAREVFGYLDHQARKYNGFVCVKVETIVKHLKKWNHKPANCSECREGMPCRKRGYSKREVEYVLRDLRRLRILSERQKHVIQGRVYHGSQWSPHDFWCEQYGHVCDFKYLAELDATQAFEDRDSSTLVTAAA